MKYLVAGVFAVAAAIGAAHADDGLRTAAAGHETSSPQTIAKLKKIIASKDRPKEQRARDRYRHPLETLSFCGIEPEMTVVEIWPGGQGAWYRRIVAPLLEDNGGVYVPVESRSRFPETVEGVPYGAADMVLVFRAHGFMIYKAPAQAHVDAVYSMLKPGGVLCIVDHAGDESVPQDPKGANGYVNESHFRALAENAGFRFLAASDINRNPRDSKDHPHGVWSLPPTLRGSPPLSADRRKYLEIGESDRFTLKFEKPR